MLQLSEDAFYDAPLNAETGTAPTVYAALVRFDFGPNYTRNLGLMKPATGSTQPDLLKGGGSVFPMFGP